MMAGKKEKVEQAPLEQPEGEAPDSEAQTKPLTQEEIDALLATAAEKAKAEAWEEYQGIQRVVSQKDQKIKELEEQVAQPSQATDDDLLQILIDERKGKVSDYGEADPLIPRLEAVVTKRKKAQQQAKAQAYFKKADAIYNQAKEVLGEDADDLDLVQVYLSAGRADLAEKKIAKAQAKKEPKKMEKQEAKPEETDSGDEYFKSEEAKRRWMEKEGLLESETPVPSGVLTSKQKARERYIKGEISGEEAQRLGADLA